MAASNLFAREMQRSKKLQAFVGTEVISSRLILTSRETEPYFGTVQVSV